MYFAFLHRRTWKLQGLLLSLRVSVLGHWLWPKFSGSPGKQYSSQPFRFQNLYVSLVQKIYLFISARLNSNDYRHHRSF